MEESKEYYYMRLKYDFFDNESIKLLQTMPDGYLYSDIYLKLCLLSLKYNGRLMYDNRIPYSSQMIAALTNHNVGVVEKAVDILQNLGLIELLSTGAIYMLDIQNYIGKSSTEADRKRAYRKQIESEKSIQINDDKPRRKDIEDKCPDICPTNLRHNTLYSNTLSYNPLNSNNSNNTNNNTINNDLNTNSKEKHSYGDYGWVKLTDAQYEKLEADLGIEELKRCIQYIDESAQSTGNKNKWKDWNLVIRRCSREGWGKSKWQKQEDSRRSALEAFANEPEEKIIDVTSIEDDGRWCF